MSALVRRVYTGGTVWYDGDHVVRIASRRTRLLAARHRVPNPTFSRYIQHNTWHFCAFEQRDLPFDDDRWIEVTW